MGIGQEIEHRSHVVGFREEIDKAASQSEDEFFRWFDNAKDKDEAFVRGSWDFMFHVAQPVARYLAHPESKVALEIGHGGGRMLASASRYFSRVIGIDIHDHNAKVEAALNERGVRNVQLYKTQGTVLPVEQETVDCVYSFIVLQHVEKYQIFKQYLEETHRVLKAGGVAVLYFGRKYVFSFNRSSRLRYAVDRLIERVMLPRGYEELPARVNGTNLRVSLAHAKRLAWHIGFDVLCDLVSRRKVPDGVGLYGGQNGFVLRKRAHSN